MDFFESSDPFAQQLSQGVEDEYGRKTWQPVRVNTPASALEELYKGLPDRFPRLFERLILSYRWAEVDLESYRLLANPLGEGLSGFLAQAQKDAALWNALVPVGYIQFGKGPDVDYDPVCFDTKSKRNGESRIVKIDHEQILCNNRVKVVAELAASFEDLVLQTIDLARRYGSRGAK